jgi:hypothetical protein
MFGGLGLEIAADAVQRQRAFLAAGAGVLMIMRGV